MSIEAKINDLEYRITALQDKHDDLVDSLDRFDASEYVDEDEFRDYLNEFENPIVVRGISMLAGDVLYTMDEVAFREEFNNWLDSYDVEYLDAYIELEEEISDLADEIADLEEELENLQEELDNA